MNFLLAEAAEALGLTPPQAGGEVTGCSIDSRTLRPGDLFVAIRGPRDDGHDYVDSAFAAGAAGAIVDSRWKEAHPGAGLLLGVEAPARALQQLAKWARRRWGGSVVAITGSNGKTTTKDTLSTLLETRRRVSKTCGNLNNELGLPLSILRTGGDAEIAVLEMGMNHAGEIRQLASIAEPNVGLVTGVTAAHLEFFSSPDDIALAKRELIESLPPAGTAVLNADDGRVRRFAGVHRGRSITFGIDQPADFKAAAIELRGSGGAAFTLLPSEAAGAAPVRFRSPLLGRHNVLNILASLAAASLFGVDPASLTAVVSRLRPARMRGEVVEIGGVTFLDDCYNANPYAVSEMLAVLRQSPGPRKIAVLGEMRELGETSGRLHRQTGREAAAASLALLIGVGGDARYIVEEAAERGLPPDAAVFFDDPADVAVFLSPLLRAGDVVLFKGSRGVGLERALDAVRKKLEAGFGPPS